MNLFSIIITGSRYAGRIGQDQREEDNLEKFAVRKGFRTLIFQVFLSKIHE